MASVDLSAECKSGFLFMKSLSFDLGQETYRVGSIATTLAGAISSVT